MNARQLIKMVETGDLTPEKAHELYVKGDDDAQQLLKSLVDASIAHNSLSLFQYLVTDKQYYRPGLLYTLMLKGKGTEWLNVCTYHLSNATLVSLLNPYSPTGMTCLAIARHKKDENLVTWLLDNGALE